MIENAPLAPHTSWRIGGPARYYHEVGHPDDLRTTLAWAQRQELPVFLLGGGTNTLIRDAGFAGLVLRYVASDWHIQAHMEDERGTLCVQAGAPMAGTMRRIAAQGWGGLEWAEGLPGTVGGAVFGNAGCYGGDMASVLERAWVLVGDEVQLWTVADMEYVYRSSRLKTQARQQATAGIAPVVLAADLQVQRADPRELAAAMARTAAARKERTPWGRSCGSVFKNPPGGASAGQLIDQAGLKGQRHGAAEISTKHANYIVNLGGASSDDVLHLIDLAQRTVQQQFGIDLELEVQIL
jgi:UDP-N-acetylmuramate dehydrogenase